MWSKERTVSILVLVDVALKAITDVSVTSSFMFQSLFWWMSLWKDWTVVAGIRKNEFQSLFWWMSLWKIEYGFIPVVVFQFQSLFWWMSLWKSQPPPWVSPQKAVSILVLVDVALKAGYFRNKRSCGGMFQSLFWWMSLWKGAVAVDGFDWRFKFQSLFWWMSLWKYKTKYFRFCEWLFQSLFWWMSLWKLYIDYLIVV